MGDRYQRGGGNLARAMGELAEVRGAGGADVKAFCAGPVHALIMAGALVQSGLYRRVVVVAGGSLAKIGMKFLGHLERGLSDPRGRARPASRSTWCRDDGREPVAAARHGGHPAARRRGRAPPGRDGAHGGAAPAVRPALSDVDRFAVELHNPDITGARGIGRRAGQQLPDHRGARRPGAARSARDGMAAFARARGLPGFSPTQGHIASAVPYLPHASGGPDVGRPAVACSSWPRAASSSGA